ncbi:hypothetical protein E2562_017358 [Oryza meyeriana var. granulata]|uniref:Disease resistance N-terminal domain-containing protein n=1 Tax=Oryza meyeriana var. granulata TaxID=110450 RepID=A0A6G1D4W2_9ORYZ|nr:hypothetical protein E2562_017358 [Oryza meyeriana var. granulata]
MEVVTGAMGTLLPKLGNLLAEEYKLHKNLRGEIMFLKAELESMETALLKISEAPIDQPPDSQVKLWARDVRDLSYDIEDTVDKFRARIGNHVPNKLHSFRGFIDRSMYLLTMAKLRHKIGTNIKEIKTRIEDVSERRDRYKVDVSLTPNMDKIFKNMLHQFDKEKYRNINEASWGEAQLINELREFLQDRRRSFLADGAPHTLAWSSFSHHTILVLHLDSGLMLSPAVPASITTPRAPCTGVIVLPLFQPCCPSRLPYQPVSPVSPILAMSEDAKAAIRRQIQMNPNNPKLDLF